MRGRDRVAADGTALTMVQRKGEEGGRKGSVASAPAGRRNEERPEQPLEAEKEQKAATLVLVPSTQKEQEMPVQNRRLGPQVE